MRQIEFDKTFIKHYRSRIKAHPKLSAQYDMRFKLFCDGVRGTPINDHALGGRKLGLRAFSVSGDIRVIYHETEAAYIFLDVGTHNQVY